ncbi:hypothetical protein BKA70DRAFT_34574 [Coprinopsis sp. MPI-PUGE-AT-0042]|nr:hypothetical protein BKA70DRAFT_34574 [Coprinopsis sp. MPI-PUGE-AT-0042]
MAVARSVYCFWEDSARPEPTAKGYDVVKAIRDIGHDLGVMKALVYYTDLSAGMDARLLPGLASELQWSGVSIVDGVTDSRLGGPLKLLLDDVLLHSKEDYSKGSVTMIISADPVVGESIAMLRQKGKEVFLVCPRASHPSLTHLYGALVLPGDMFCKVTGRASFPLLAAQSEHALTSPSLKSAPRSAGFQALKSSSLGSGFEDLTSKQTLSPKVDCPKSLSAASLACPSSSAVQEPDHRPAKTGAIADVPNLPRHSVSAKEVTPQSPQEAYILPPSALIDIPWWFHPLVHYLREAKATKGIDTHSREAPKSFVVQQPGNILLHAAVSYGKGDPWCRYLQKAAALGIVKILPESPTPLIRLTPRWAADLTSTSSCGATSTTSTTTSGVPDTRGPKIKPALLSDIPSDNVVIYGPDADLHIDTLSAARSLVSSVADFNPEVVVAARCYGGDFFAIEMDSETIANVFAMSVNEGRGKLCASACLQPMYNAFMERDSPS